MKPLGQLSALGSEVVGAIRRNGVLPTMAVVLPAAAFVVLVLVALIQIGLGYVELSSFTVYQTAVRDWWSGIDPYGRGINGFLYLPASILLFTPFALLGRVTGAILWCSLSAGLYATGLARIARLLAPDRQWVVLGIALTAVWFSAKANLSDGQAQVAMTGLLLHAAADIKLAHWPRVAAELALAVALKPIAVPMLGLAFVFYPPLRKMLLLAMLFVLLLPFLHTEPRFVARAYYAALVKLQIAGSPPRGAYPNISTLLDSVGLQLNETAQLVVRAAAALAVLGIAIRARQTRQSSLSFVILALSLSYLTLFNPRSESVSYVALTPAVGLSAGLLLARTTQTKLGWLFLAMGVALGVPNHRGIDAWLKPSLALPYFTLIAVYVVWRRPARWLGSVDGDHSRV